jgi:hypothetical protein
MMDVKIEPERPEDRHTRFHVRIKSTTRIQGTKTGCYADLECGHRAIIFGNIEMAEGKALCMECRDKAAAS